MVVLAVTMSAALAAQGPLASDPCAAFADDAKISEPDRPVSVRDLATIADIGQASPHDVASSPFGVWPVGRLLAFVVRRRWLSVLGVRSSKDMRRSHGTSVAIVGTKA